MPYVGEIRMFSGDYAPEGWAFCDGALLPLSGHEELYSLIGTVYGGDGHKDFALPDMRGRVPVAAGAATGLTPRLVGQKDGTETVEISLAGMPSHSHPVNVSTATATAEKPGTGVNLAASTLPVAFYGPATAQVQQTRVLNAAAVGFSGGNAGGSAAPHANIMPSFTLNFIIALRGEYPELS